MNGRIFGYWDKRRQMVVGEQSGRAWEREIWEHMLWSACEVGGMVKAWMGKDGVCEGARRIWISSSKAETQC